MQISSHRFLIVLIMLLGIACQPRQAFDLEMQLAKFDRLKTKLLREYRKFEKKFTLCEFGSREIMGKRSL
jgi:hypothetical protein